MNFLILIVLVIIIVAVFMAAILIVKNGWPVTTKSPMKADYVIIGGGVAGCVIARRLSERFPKRTVIILERGLDMRFDEKVFRTDLAGTIAYEPPYSEVLSTNYPGVQATVGRIYGGGSSHNYGLVVEGSKEYYKNYTNIDPSLYRDRIKKLMPSIPVTETPPFSPSLSFLSTRNIIPFVKEGFTVLYNIDLLGMNKRDLNKVTKVFQMETPQLQIVDDYNKYLGSIGKYQYLFNDPTNGVRASVNRQYFFDKYYQQNLKIVENAEVDYIDEPNVHLKDGRVITANMKIILSSGSIQTPRIVNRSSSIKHPMTGKNLRNHYGFQIILASKDIKPFLSGPVVYTSDENKTRREYQCIVSNLVNYQLLDEKGIDYKSYVDNKYSIFSFTFFLLNPSGYGDVTQTQINLSMFNEEDTIKINDAYEWLERVYTKLGAVKLFPSNPRDSLIIADHYSCTMRDTIDSNYKLTTSKMTYIVDASVFSEIPDGNTEFPVLTLAEHVADILTK